MVTIKKIEWVPGETINDKYIPGIWRATLAGVPNGCMKHFYGETNRNLLDVLRAQNINTKGW